MPAPTILIVDDDVDFSNELAERLTAEGYQVSIINQSLEAYQNLLKASYNLVLLDYKMPGLNGIALLKLVKKAKPATKVIIISGRPFIEKLLEAEEATSLVNGFINKPFKDADLLNKIKTALSE